MTNPPTVEERIANLEGSFDQIAIRLDRLEQDGRDLRRERNTRFDQITGRINRAYARFDPVEAKFDQIDARAEQRTREIIKRLDRVVLGMFGLLAAIVASVVANVLVQVFL